MGEDVDCVGYVNLRGTTSTSESYRTALNFARPPKQPTKEFIMLSTLKVICIHNYGGFNGFRMNSALFSAHPGEREVLLMEGSPMVVLGMEEMYIDNLWTDDPF